jgi:glycosyltransferase involved in cell wall biosynthesis
MKILFTFQYHQPLVLGGAEISGDLWATALGERAEVMRLAAAWDARPAPRDGLLTFAARGNPRSVSSLLKNVPSAMRAVRAAVREFEPDWVVANSAAAGIWTVAAVRTMRHRPRCAVVLRDYGWWCPTHVCRLTHGAPFPDCGTVRFARTCSHETMELYRSPRHGASYWLGLMARWTWARVSARFAGLADLRLTNSEHLAATWTEREGRRIVALGGGALAPDGDVSTLTDPTARPLTVAMMARGSRGKGAHLFAAAARVLAPQGWRFIAYGDAGDVQEDGVERLPKVSPAEAQAAMAAAHLVVVPSVSPEALGRTAIEAQMVGTPVVVFPNTGVPEAVAPTGGVIASDVHAEALIEALLVAQERLVRGEFDLLLAREWLVERHGVPSVASRLLVELARVPK